MTSAIDIAAAVASGDTTATAVLEEHLARIAEREGEIHAFNVVLEEQARADAAAVDAGERRGPLAGVPLALKDNNLLDVVDDFPSKMEPAS